MPSLVFNVIIKLGYMFKKIILIILSVAGPGAFACSVKNPSYMNLAISTAEEKIFSYGFKSTDVNLPNSVVSNCRETAMKRRFLMITFGPDVVAQNDVIRGNNFNKVYASNNCSIKNNPLTKNKQTDEDAKNRFSSKWKFINECLEVQVTELGPRPLSYPADQAGCIITPYGERSASFSGGYCFFKPAPDSELNITYNVKPSCRTLKGFKENGVSLQDLEASVNFYTSATYKDDINDLVAIGTFPVRLSVNPVDSLFKASDDFGILRPTFPGNFPVNDIHLGEITLSDYGKDAVLLKAPYIVNNFCKSIDKDGLKSSICNYVTPYVGEVKLYNSKGVVEASWFDGGLAGAQWQGILNVQGERIPRSVFKENETYKIEVTFSDPYFEYNSYKKLIKSRMAKFTTGFPGLFESDGISTIPTFGEIDDIDDMTEVDGVGEVNFPASIPGLDNSLKRLASYFTTTMYPPMYSKACSTETGECVNVGRPFVKLMSTFKVDERFFPYDIEASRESKILGSYKKKIIEQPEYNCN